MHENLLVQVRPQFQSIHTCEICNSFSSGRIDFFFFFFNCKIYLGIPKKARNTKEQTKAQNENKKLKQAQKSQNNNHQEKDKNEPNKHKNKSSQSKQMQAAHTRPKPNPNTQQPNKNNKRPNLQNCSVLSFCSSIYEKGFYFSGSGIRKTTRS